MKRTNLIALVLVPPMLLESLTSLASNRTTVALDNATARGMADQITKQKSKRILLPVAFDQTEKRWRGRLSKQAETRRLDTLQASLRVYDPRRKSGR
jgi:hypothetical protein